MMDQKQREYNIRWREKNREKVRAWNRRWKKKNPEKVREERKAYKQRPEVRERENARSRARSAAGTQPAQVRRKQIKSSVDSHKVERGCLLCGYNKCAAALHFHHNGEKEFTVAQANALKYSFARILKEIQKCSVLCANCHSEVHAGVAEINPGGGRA